MELRQLKCFLAVAEELNFSRAALRMNMTQPPLSLQIQNLEQELGVSLFHRNNRHVELTSAGRVFYEEVHRILRDLDGAGEQARRAARGEIGTLRVGFVGSATYDILPTVLREYRRLYPDVQVSLHEMSTPDQLDALHKEKIDVGVLRPSDVDDSVSTKIVQASPCVLVVPASHPLLMKKEIQLTDLVGEAFAMLSRKTWAGLYDQVLSLCNPKIIQEALEFQTVIGLVAAGMGISVVPQSAMNLHTQEVAYVEIKAQLPMALMGISWRKEDRSPLVKAFVELADGGGQVEMVK